MKSKTPIAVLAFVAVLVFFAGATLINLTNQVTGTLPHGNGGTDVTSPGSAGHVLRSTGSAWASAVLALSDLSGSVSCSTMPALTGDTTSSAGSCAMTTSKTGGVSFAASATTDATNASNIASGTLGCGEMPALTGNATSSAGSCATTLAVVYRRHPCDFVIGDASGSAITNAQLGPQKRVCYIPAPSTIVEMDVSADGGTPNIILAVNHAGSDSNIVSSALATAGSGGIACSNTGGTTGLDGATTCSATLQNTSATTGDYLEAVSGTAGGVAKLMTVHVIYTVN